MKDIQIPNGYFHLWQTYIAAKGLDHIIMNMPAHEREQFESILSAPIAMQSSYSFFFKLIEMTYQEFSKLSFIFEMAQYVKPEHFGVLGYMASRSNSVAEAIGYILRFSRLAIDGEEIIPMQMYQEDDLLLLSWPYISEDYNLINELTNALMIALAKQILPYQEFPLYAVNMAHEPLLPIYEYQKFYGCKVEFKQSQYSFVINMRSLNLKLEQADPSLMQLLIKQAEEAIASKPSQISNDRQLQKLIADYLKTHQRAPKIEEIAYEMHVSVRTLQRQMKVMGTTFKKILEIQRMLRCEKLLEQKMELSEIAVQLGYSDQSALARAFKAHFGMTLLEKRRQQS